MLRHIQPFEEQDKQEASNIIPVKSKSHGAYLSHKFEKGKHGVGPRVEWEYDQGGNSIKVVPLPAFVGMGMGPFHNKGKYQLRQTIGEGTFAKVKLAVDTTNGHFVAIKVIDKKMVLRSNLKHQVQREIRTMKLLHHPNIVRIHEVLGSKTKIYIVMEYVSGGHLLEKLSSAGKFDEREARKIFQQLIDALDYCHHRGVYHRDLKPENLLLDDNGNLKVSDFGLSALRQPGDLLSTACGSPCYVAPELLEHKGYDGAAADVWSCGVILFELLAGFLPFDDPSILNLYKKISKAEYACPAWFTSRQEKLLRGLFDPNPKSRMAIQEIVEDPWFQENYVPACGHESREKNLDDIKAAFEGLEDENAEKIMPRSTSFINAFQLIAMSHELDLSGLFEEENENKLKTRLGSNNTMGETFKKIEAAAADLRLSVERSNNKMKMQLNQKTSRCSRSSFHFSAEVIEVAPTHCVVEVSKLLGEPGVYKEFCQSLSSLLREATSTVSPTNDKSEDGIPHTKDSQESRCYQVDNKVLRGYSSS